MGAIMSVVVDVTSAGGETEDDATATATAATVAGNVVVVTDGAGGASET